MWFLKLSVEAPWVPLKMEGGVGECGDRKYSGLESEIIITGGGCVDKT